MENNKKIVKLKLDIIFKRVFGNEKNDKIIAAFIEDLLEMPRGSIEEIEIKNVELPPEELDKKFSRLDLKLMINGKIVNIEMQVNYEADFKDRTLFHWAKMFSDELESGEEYGNLKHTICINIINFKAFECDEYHSHFRILEKNRKEVLTDKFDIHFFELKKIKKFKQNKPMEDWLNLINAETEGELMNIEGNTQIKEVKDTIVILRELSADEKVRELAYYREKRLHDEASALRYARREGIAEGRAEGIAEGEVKGKNNAVNEIAENLRAMGMTEEQIRKATNIK